MTHRFKNRKNLDILGLLSARTVFINETGGEEASEKSEDEEKKEQPPVKPGDGVPINADEKDKEESEKESGPEESIPERPPEAMTGTQFAEHLKNLEAQTAEKMRKEGKSSNEIANEKYRVRERAVYEQIVSGNLPKKMREFKDVEVSMTDKNGKKVEGTIKVMPDYLMIGSDEDAIRVPMSPATAQLIARQFNCTLPTDKMVDAIAAQARRNGVSLQPTPKPDQSRFMQTQYFIDHEMQIREQMKGVSGNPLVAGDKKDIVLPYGSDGTKHVVIYGWHQKDGSPIQPYSGPHHEWSYMDYSHGVRLVSRTMTIRHSDGRVEQKNVADVLGDKDLYKLISRAPIKNSTYAYKHPGVVKEIDISGLPASSPPGTSQPTQVAAAPEAVAPAADASDRTPSAQPSAAETPADNQPPTPEPAPTPTPTSAPAPSPVPASEQPAAAPSAEPQPLPSPPAPEPPSTAQPQPAPPAQEPPAPEPSANSHPAEAQTPSSAPSGGGSQSSPSSAPATPSYDSSATTGGGSAPETAPQPSQQPQPPAESATQHAEVQNKKKVIVLGDSLSEGAGPHLGLDNVTPRWESGRYASTMKRVFENMPESECRGGTLYVLGGGNDIFDANRSVEAITADLEAIYKLAAQRGMKVIAATYPPFGNSRYVGQTPAHVQQESELRQKWEALNNWILGREGKTDESGTKIGPEKILQFHKIFADPSDRFMMRPDVRAADGVHMTPGGYVEMAGHIKDATLQIEQNEGASPAGDPQVAPENQTGPIFKTARNPHEFAKANSVPPIGAPTAFFGDSINTAITSAPYLKNGGHEYFAKGGQRTPWLLDRVNSVAPRLNKFTNAVVLIGTNDIGMGGGETPEVIFERISQIWDAILRANPSIKLHVCTIPPFGNYKGYSKRKNSIDQRRVAINDKIRAAARNNPKLKLIDLCLPVEQGGLATPDGAALDRSVCYEPLHPDKNALAMVYGRAINAAG